MATAYETSYPTHAFPSIEAGVIPEDVYGVAINQFINRTPLFSRLPRLPVGSQVFKTTNDQYRPRTFSLSGNLDSSETSVGVADGSVFLEGDVLEVENEAMLVTSVSGDTLTVVRGYAGTSKAAHTASGLIGYLVGNTRTGADVDIEGLSRLPSPTDQYVQVIIHPYQVGGSLHTTANYVSGFSGPLDRDRMMALQHAADDFEVSAYYGFGVAPSAGGRTAQKGLRSLIQTNKVTTPTNASAYKPSDLIRDTIERVAKAGGKGDVLLVSLDFQTGLNTWGAQAQRLEAGANVFGTPIDSFAVSFMPGAQFIPAPLLRPGTVICLSADEVRQRVKVPMFDKPRGSRGHAVEGDIIFEAAIELENEAHHAWVSGITGFAAN